MGLDKIINDWCKDNRMTRQEFADAEPGSASDLFKDAFGITREDILGAEKEISYSDCGAVEVEENDLRFF